MKVFISSVRRDLEEERDALPGIITAIGHTPIRFEDFTAQPVPSREACLAGIADADAYVLLVGPHYGYRFPDTGQSPTHDEWAAATAAGKPRLVYRKNGVTLDADQEKFVTSIGNYASGVFYDTFNNTPELLTKVVAKIRELEQRPPGLVFTPLTAPVTVAWRDAFDTNLQRNVSGETFLEVHILPVGAPARPARVHAEVAEALPDRVRATGVIPATQGIQVSRDSEAVTVTIEAPRLQWNEPRLVQVRGIRLATTGQVSIWASLPGDSMGAVLDEGHLPTQIADLLRLVGQLPLIEAERIAIAAGIQPTMMISLGRVDRLPRQQASPLSLNDRPVRIEPDEQVTLAALDAGAIEAARPLAKALIAAATTRR